MAWTQRREANRIDNKAITNWIKSGTIKVTSVTNPSRWASVSLSESLRFASYVKG